MPGQLYFADNFWENDQINGTTVLTNRMRDAKHSCELLKHIYEARASIEQEYGQRMMQMAQDIRVPDEETGGVRDIIDAVQQGLESTAENKLQLSEAIRSNLVLPLSNLIQGQKSIKAQTDSTIQKSLSARQLHVQSVLKTRERYNSECLRANKELQKCTAKERKSHYMRSNTVINNLYKDHEDSMTHLETAVNNWNTEWRFGCEIFEQLEEERIEFFRENLAQYYTLLLENCETKESFDISRQNVLDINVDKELDQFVKDHRSTSTIPNMIDYISFSAATATTDGTTAHTNHTIGTGTGTGTDTDTDTDTDTNPQQDVTRQRFEQTTEHTPRRDPDPRPSKSVLKNKTPEIKQNIRSSQPSKLSQPPQEAPRAMLAHMKIYDWEESDEDQDSDEYQESDIENDNGSDSYSSHDREIARTIAQASKDECHDNHLVTSSPLPMTSSAEPSVDPILDMPSVDANFDDSPRSSSSRVNDELEDMLQQLEKQKKVSSIGSAKGASITSSRYPPRQRPTKNTTTTTTAASGTASAISATKINHLQRNESGRSTSSMESSASDDLFDPVSRKSTAPTLSSVGSGNPLGTSRNTLADLDMNVNPNRQQSPSTGQSRNDLESWRSESMSPSNTGTELTFVDYAIARFDYAAKDEDEISFTKGDLLGIIDKNEDGWWLSRRWEEASGWSEQGCAPNNYLTLVEA